MRVAAVLPCFDEDQSISDLVFLTNQMVGMSIVADDKSSDKTVERAKEAGAYVARNFGKRGAGITTKVGIDEALLLGCDVVVTLDGDGQHDPNDIPRLLKPILDNEADVVVGTRFTGDNPSKILPYRRFGIKVITLLFNFGHSQKLSDVQCCFRAFSRQALEKLDIEEAGFTFSVETVVKARAFGFRVAEVPVNVLYHRQFSRNSTLNPIVHGLSVALGTVKWRIKIELLPKIRHWLKG